MPSGIGCIGTILDNSDLVSHTGDSCTALSCSGPGPVLVRIADTVFDILNSTSLRSGSLFKQALHAKNFDQVRAKMQEAREYIKGLQAKRIKEAHFRPNLETVWHTGFLGFLVNMDSVEALYKRLVVSKTLWFLPT